MRVYIFALMMTVVSAVPFWMPRYFGPYPRRFAPSWYRAPAYYTGFGYHVDRYFDAPPPPVNHNQLYQPKLRYFGKLEDSCTNAADGLYYVDEHTFAFCSNGQKSIQACAEGSANPPIDYFHDGSYYGFKEFCSINLLAHDYFPRHEHGSGVVGGAKSEDSEAADGDNTVPMHADDDSDNEISPRAQADSSPKLATQPLYEETDHHVIESDD